MYALLNDTNTAVVQYPYTIRMLLLAHPNVSFPRDTFTDAVLLPYHVVKVVAMPPPAYDPAAERLVEGVPVKAGSAWEQTWTIVPLTQQEIDDLADHNSITTDLNIRALLKARPVQIENWIMNNVTDLASARQVLIRLAKFLSLHAKRELT